MSRWPLALLGAMGWLMCSAPCAAAAQQTGAPALLVPVAIAYDTAGNLYIADEQRNQVSTLR